MPTNSICRAATAAPALLPMMKLKCVYGDETRLHTVAVPEGARPGMPQRGVRKGTRPPVGPLLLTTCLTSFALILQPVFGPGSAACAEAPFVSYLDAFSIVGKVRPAAGALRLRMDDDRVCGIGLDARMFKSGICDGYNGLTNELDGLTAAGTSLASTEYVSRTLGERAATVEALVGTLVQIPPSVPAQNPLLRALLQVRTVPHPDDTAPLVRTESPRAACVANDADASDWQPFWTSRRELRCAL